mmetsp:Transcript_16053/g.34768  ORF Transcript_16053/g.34768 Transcript_16053/m.34768 type:complete len:171 (-) Transcript_16053:111-623(-)
MSIDNTVSKADGANAPTKASGVKKRVTSLSKSAIKSGRWTVEEKATFLKGLKMFGKGKWKEIATMIPTRSTIQVKTHAQQIIKRVEAGEDIYAYLESQPTTASTTTSPPTPNTTTAKSDGFEDSFQMSRRKVSYDSDQDIDAALRELSQKDHGAVEILYQMTQKSTVRVL